LDQGKNRVLEFTNGSKRKMKAKLSCVTFLYKPIRHQNVSDRINYVNLINEFPCSVVVFCDQERNEALSHIHIGNEFTLQEWKALHSCIWCTDVHGLSFIRNSHCHANIEIKITQSPMQSGKTVYSTFKLSMVKNSMFLAQECEENFYEEVRKDDGTVHLYDLLLLEL